MAVATVVATRRVAVNAVKKAVMVTTVIVVAMVAETVAAVA